MRKQAAIRMGTKPFLPFNHTLLWLSLITFLYSPATLAVEQTPSETQAATQPAIEQVEDTRAVEQPSYPPTLPGAKQAFSDKNYAEALKILAKLEGDHAGQVEFDYLFGRTALESGSFDAAVAAFTRVLTVDPDFAAARFELARTYYSKGVALLARGPFEQARHEFTLVANMNPPSELREAIEQYQTNIDKYLKVRDTQFKMFAEMTAGYDSNIGARSEKETFTYYDTGMMTDRTFYLDKDKDRQDSAFGELQAGIGLDWPLFSNDFEVFGNLLFGGRSYGSNHGYDQIWNGVQLGVRHYGEKNVKTIRARFTKVDVFDDFKDKQRYNDNGDLMLKLAVKYTENTAMDFWLLGGHSSYHIYDTHVFSVESNRQAMELTHILPGPRKAALQALLLTGEDFPQQCHFPPCPDMYTRGLVGIRAAWSINIFDATRLYTSLYLEESKYNHHFFNQQRRDDRAELFIGTNTRLGKTWYFRPRIHYTHNDSNLSIYHFERWTASMTFGWEI